jgi:hypothetical protein
MNDKTLDATGSPITAAKVVAERDANGGTMHEAKERLALAQKPEVRIENWFIDGDRLHGDAIGHPTLGNEWVRTSTILSANMTTRRVVTRNRVYLLGEPRKTGAASTQPDPRQDAYEGAMEDVAIWKKRALEAEAWQAKMRDGSALLARLEAAEAKPAVPVLADIEQYRIQMAGISTAALGYWKEGDTVDPAYDTLALRDVAKLYVKYDTLFKANEAKVPVNDNSASVAAIQFALEAEQGKAYLRLWNEGEFEACRHEWPEAPDECYIGADQFFVPQTDAALEKQA